MFRRVKSAGDEPLANQLRIEAEPNVLKSGKPGKSGKDAAGRRHAQISHACRGHATH